MAGKRQRDPAQLADRRPQRAQPLTLLAGGEPARSASGYRRRSGARLDRVLEFPCRPHGHLVHPSRGVGTLDQVREPAVSSVGGVNQTTAHPRLPRPTGDQPALPPDQVAQRRDPPGGGTGWHDTARPVAAGGYVLARTFARRQPEGATRRQAARGVLAKGAPHDERFKSTGTPWRPPASRLHLRRSSRREAL